MKKYKIIFWVTVILIFLFEGVMPALTVNSAMAKEGIKHLGYPEYFGLLLTTFKVLGALALIIPMVPARIKEWAYAGFTFDFTSAFVSMCAVDGFTKEAVGPIIAIVILMVSYVAFRKIQKASVEVS
jgi:hypothetical protein